MHPERVPATGENHELHQHSRPHCFLSIWIRDFTAGSVCWHPFGMRDIVAPATGGVAALNQPANGCNSFGVDKEKSLIDTLPRKSASKDMWYDEPPALSQRR